MTDVSTTAPKTPRRARREPDDSEILRLSQVFAKGLGGIPVLLLLAFALSLATDSFLTGTNLDNLGRQVSIYAVLAAAELLVILTAGIDLSVGSVVGLAGVVAAKTMFETTGGLPVVWGVLLALLVGAVAGLVNGLLVAFLKLPPFIVTLGMMGIARGTTLLLTQGRTVQPLPEGFATLAGGEFLGVANLIWLMLLVTVVVGLLLRRTVWGRYVYAIGSNAESARLTGVPVRLVQVSAYTLAGLLAAFAGVLLASRLGNGVPTAGDGYELQAIAACVIGGASLFGARGTALGALVGALVVGLLNNGGTLLGVDPFWLQIAIGVLILAAVAAEHLQNLRTRRPAGPTPGQPSQPAPEAAS
ncbi:ABC transporter permease [Goodfellowiella coeruleoviolacea]|uniref:Monosaccharide ABC transporter membrane protein, CUT2 family (TC 3.A.1.2.-) n=1 Tax=Goodfellowiella coeruleoviolacea TaxID=334858 RepID=A0AAE3GAS4_9PSEU|nr:ABC transporter permease [Goodfellowiella coeruleoviolacea]MCP2163872.1 monosaccharide ABC transporter membrane protein, CUT2 family (TC 3.A.1.2.-) [Goodfellowiella coeruleoviolacea]